MNTKLTRTNTTAWRRRIGTRASAMRKLRDNLSCPNFTEEKQIALQTPAVVLLSHAFIFFEKRPEDREKVSLVT
jgi:hypothetical protein